MRVPRGLNPISSSEAPSGPIKAAFLAIMHFVGLRPSDFLLRSELTLSSARFQACPNSGRKNIKQCR